MYSYNVSDIENALTTDPVALLLTPSEEESAVRDDIARYYTADKDALMLYVTLTKPYHRLETEFSQKGVRTENFFYIDAVSKLANSSLQRTKNAVFLRPTQLTNLSITLENAVKELPKERDKVLMFDTVSTLTLYHNTNTVSKFLHSLTSKIRGWGLKSILMALEEETDETFRSRLTQFCDRIIHIEDLRSDQ